MPRSSRLHTHYDNLKVARDAPPEVIRAAYRSLCHKFHPDRHGGSAQATYTFQLINRAYEVLNDPGQRQRHDEWIAREESVALHWDGQDRRRHRWPFGIWCRRVGQAAGMRASRQGPVRRRRLIRWASGGFGARIVRGARSVRGLRGLRGGGAVRGPRVVAVLGTSVAALAAMLFALYAYGASPLT